MKPGPYRLLFVLLLLPYVYFNHSDGWNQTSRLAELHAVVLKHSFRIDAYEATDGRQGARRRALLQREGAGDCARSRCRRSR